MNLTHSTIFVCACLVLLAGLISFWLILRSQSLPANRFRAWFGGALSAFIDGCFDGVTGGGSAAGGAILACDGQAHADLQLGHLLIEALHLIAGPLFCGLADVRSYRKTSPFPNLWAPAAPGEQMQSGSASIRPNGALAAALILGAFLICGTTGCTSTSGILHAASVKYVAKDAQTGKSVTFESPKEVNAQKMDVTLDPSTGKVTFSATGYQSSNSQLVQNAGQAEALALASASQALSSVMAQLAPLIGQIAPLLAKQAAATAPATEAPPPAK